MGSEMCIRDRYAPLTKKGDAILLGQAEVIANFDICHPNWDEAMYDSEEKVLIPFESITGEIESNLTISFAMSVSIKKGKLDAIEKVQFTNESEFIYIDFYPSDPWN